MRLKSLVLLIGLMPSLVVAQVVPTGQLQAELQGKKQAELQGKKQAELQKVQQTEQLAESLRGSTGKMTPPIPDANMASPVPPVSSSVNSQMPSSYPGQSAIPQSSVGMPPPTIRAEMPGQTVPSMPRVESQVQNRSPAVNLAPNR